MAAPHGRLDPQKHAQAMQELRRDRALREQGYRAQALRLLPHVCASCGREFADRRLSELTVHHKDHNWKNNPPDGSNWELLCVYCHDHEHEKFLMAGHGGGGRPEEGKPGPPVFSPFAGLDALMGGEKTDERAASGGGRTP